MVKLLRTEELDTSGLSGKAKLRSKAWLWRLWGLDPEFSYGVPDLLQLQALTTTHFWTLGSFL